MIFDSEDAFPNSVVHYIEFPSYPLREMFAYLREKEELLQRVLRNEKKGTYVFAKATVELAAIQAMLIYMIHNCSRAEHRRRGTKALIEAARRKRVGAAFGQKVGVQLDMFSGGNK